MSFTRSLAATSASADSDTAARIAVTRSFTAVSLSTLLTCTSLVWLNVGRRARHPTRQRQPGNRSTLAQPWCVNFQYNDRPPRYERSQFARILTAAAFVLAAVILNPALAARRRHPR